MSSKASALGTGSSFQAARTISPRRAAINAATNAPTEGAPPPIKLPVSQISLNPANPRSELGDLTDLVGSLRDHGQKMAISIMSRFAYLEANPDREAELEEDTKYVVIDGSSRLAAAREAGLTEIKVMLDEDLGSNPDELLESALVANIHRQDLDHLDEAKALQQLLTVHGTQEALAARLHRSQGWVSQRLALLSLTPQLQQKLAAGEEPADLLRQVGRKKPEEQDRHLQRLKDKRTQEKADKQAGAKNRKSSRGGAIGTGRGDAGRSATDEDHYDVMNGSAGNSSPQTSKLTEAESPRSTSAAASSQAGVPWEDGSASMDIIFQNLSQPERRRMISRLLELLETPEAFVADLLAASSQDYRHQVADLLLKDS
ncbi:ParB/RepB/Spo0J family partition protein [Streptomyces cucumeris]|uniref:ParB/RepB/Spo0J family partition protein n=1 Tax=Streptomyces cucumeris TaxID=2962890 RepID=UPI003D7064B9